MNMPAFEGNLIHQIILEVDGVGSLKELKELMNREEFVLGSHWYRRKNMYTQKDEWMDRGKLIVNTSHIGKVVEFIDLDERYSDDSQKGSGVVRTGYQGPRRPMRP